MKRKREKKKISILVRTLSQEHLPAEKKRDGSNLHLDYYDNRRWGKKDNMVMNCTASSTYTHKKRLMWLYMLNKSSSWMHVQVDLQEDWPSSGCACVLLSISRHGKPKTSLIINMKDFSVEIMHRLNGFTLHLKQPEPAHCVAIIAARRRRCTFRNRNFFLMERLPII